MDMRVLISIAVVAALYGLLQHRLRRGVKIPGDPGLLLRFLQRRLASQPQPVFARVTQTMSA